VAIVAASKDAEDAAEPSSDNDFSNPSYYMPEAPKIEDFEPKYDAADYQSLSGGDKISVVHDKDIDVELDLEGVIITVSKDHDLARDILEALSDQYSSSESESESESSESESSDSDDHIVAQVVKKIQELNDAHKSDSSSDD